MMKWLSILSVLLLASVATAQDYAEESGASAAQQEMGESDPLALPLIKALIDKVEQGLMPELGGLRIDIQRTAADLANQIRNLPKIPDEIKEILPPQVGVDGSLGFDLRLSAPDGERWTTYWHPVSSNINEDVMVSVSSSNAAGYLGLTSSDGVLQTESNITYSIVGDSVLLSVDSDVVAEEINSGDTPVTNIVETDYIFGAYSNSTEFVNDVRAAQTNDGYEANTDDQEITTFSIVSNQLTIALEGDAASPHSVDMTPYIGGTTTGVTSHVVLSNLLWSGSGHYGTANRVAAFDGAGAATYLIYSNWNTAYGWGDHAGLYIPTAYSNSASFISDVRAAQTNDGFEADTDTWFIHHLEDFTNAVRSAQTNDGFEANTDTTDHAAFSNLEWIVSGHTGTAQRIAAFDNDGSATYIDYANWDTAYGWGSHIGLYIPIAYSNSQAFIDDVRAAQTNVVDTDTTYTAGDGLVLVGFEFSIDPDWSESNILSVVTNEFPNIFTNDTESSVCNQNEHPDDSDDSTGTGGSDVDDGTSYPGDGSDYPGGYADGTGHASDPYCYSTVPDPIP